MSRTVIFLAYPRGEGIFHEPVLGIHEGPFEIPDGGSAPSPDLGSVLGLCGDVYAWVALGIIAAGVALAVLAMLRSASNLEPRRGNVFLHRGH